MLRPLIISSVVLAMLGSSGKTRSAIADKPSRHRNLTTKRRCAKHRLPRDSSVSRAASPLHPVAAHSTFKGVALSKLEILPPSISILGPRYAQRVVVEATFVDGHQEDVTSEVQTHFFRPENRPRGS